MCWPQAIFRAWEGWQGMIPTSGMSAGSWKIQPLKSGDFGCRFSAIVEQVRYVRLIPDQLLITVK